MSAQIVLRAAAIPRDSIFRSLSGNVSESDFITCKSVEDNFKDTIKKFRIKNINKVIISQINVNYIRNKIELLSEAVWETLTFLRFLKL